jgi:tetratricopeptide (TPR) repeat protein
MNARAERPHRRIVVGLGLTVLLAFVAWRVLSLGLADHLSRQNPDAALAWRGTHPEAQLRRIEQVVEDAPKIEQNGAARAAIRSAPLDGRGYRMLAQQAELRGNLPNAAALYSLAAIRSPRDLPSQRWLTKYALGQQDYASALRHIDQMLRVQPQLHQFLYRLLVALAALPEAQADIADLLLREPPWRAEFMPQLTGRSPDSGVLFGLMERLRRSPSGLSDAELSAWIDRLAYDRQWGAAYLIWAQSLSPDAGQRIGNVFNGSFEREPSNSGFDWRVVPIPGAQVSRVQVTGADSQLALRIAFEDRRVPFQNVRQLLALAPGSYRLEGRVRLDDLRSERGLVWTLTCAEDKRPIAETEPISGRRSWGGFVLDFAVPATDCGGQWLTLRIPARIPAERRVGGVAWFDDLKIQARSD